MFIVSISYKVSLDKVDALIPEHIEFLEEYYQQGKFLMSGRKVPRTGGLILATANSIEELNTIIAEDPFYKAGIADYEVTEFLATKYAKGLESMESY